MTAFRVGARLTQQLIGWGVERLDGSAFWFDHMAAP